jgi:hypothetical protein
VLPLLLGHAAVAGRRGGADLGRAAAEGLFRRRGERTEAHPRDRHRDLQLEGALRKACPEDDVGRAALAVALERVARDRRAEKEQVVEVRQRALGAEAADVIDALARGALDRVDRVAIEDRALAQTGAPAACHRAPLEPVALLAEQVELGHATSSISTDPRCPRGSCRGAGRSRSGGTRRPRSRSPRRVRGAS